MERSGIAAAIASPMPSVYWGDAPGAVRWARHCNEFLAGVVRDDPTHFGGFAALPIPDTGAACKELGYALDTLGLDGVIGPWFLPALRVELSGGPSVSYLVLRAPELEALRRVRERQGPGASARVRHMVAAFAELGELRSHAVDTAGRTPEEVLRIAQHGLAEGRFRLDG